MAWKDTPLGSFGLVALLVVVAIVLMLAAQAWEKLAPTAVRLEGQPPGETLSVTVGGTGATVGGEQLPDLNDLRRGTDAHAKDVQEALATAE